MNIVNIIQEGVADAVKNLYDSEITAESVSMNTTRSEFEGDYTVVAFAFAKVARKKPEAIAEDLGQYLVENVKHIEKYNVVKGFCNLVISNQFWVNFLAEAAKNGAYGTHAPTGKKVMVEFSSPNTNKPLHLGHIRNILLGWSVNKMFQAAGYEVIKTQIVNDRGIAVCKSMLAWQLYGNGETPADSGVKGDHFVGKFYVKFSNELKAEYAAWQVTDDAEKEFVKYLEEHKKKSEKIHDDIELIFDDETQKLSPAKNPYLKSREEKKADFFKDYKNNYFNEYSKLGAQAKALLLKWEANDEDIRALWAKMNDWVYEGYAKTYENLGVDFDTLYYESNTYLLGKEIIAEGLKKDIFTQEGKRIMVELDNIGLGTKTVIKSDGTSTYTSQDLGTAQVRYKEYGTERMVYVVGDEQISHFQGVFEILKRMGEPYAEGLFHLAYGMVDLPTGKMKSREGTVVDADDLMKEVIDEARNNAQERGELVDLPEAEREDIYRKIGMAALKYFILKVAAQKRMVFNPKESVETQGDTGPYIQYSYVRIQGILAKAEKENIDFSGASNYLDLKEIEKEILNQIYQYPGLVLQAAEQYEPSIIANFCYSLAKNYSKFYHENQVVKAETEDATIFRLKLSKVVGSIIMKGMDLLGIEMPKKM